MTAGKAVPRSMRRQGARGRRRRAAGHTRSSSQSRTLVGNLVEVRRLLGRCDDAVLRTRWLLDTAGSGGAGMVWYREARRRAELLETCSRELAEVLEVVEREAVERGRRERL